MRKKFKLGRILTLLIIVVLGMYLLNFVRGTKKVLSGELATVNSLLNQEESDDRPWSQYAPIVDLSGWQDPAQIDYDLLSSRIYGAVVRVQHGGENPGLNSAAYGNGKDKAYTTHIEELQARGIPVAVYAYVGGRSVSEMKAEARDFYERANAYNPTYWWLDVEEESMADMDAEVEAFRSELKRLGAKKVGLYSQDWFLSAHDISTGNFDALWFAHYGADTGYLDTRPDSRLSYQLHQYTSKGHLPGYAGELDFNIPATDEDYSKLFTDR